MNKDIIGKKPDWMYKQSGVVPIVNENGVVKVVLITSTSTGYWVFPKGVIEKGMTAQESALKEAYEEAGIKGFAYENELGSYEYEKWSGLCEVKMYLMEVQEVFENWEDEVERKRTICGLEEALFLIDNGDLKRILREAEIMWNEVRIEKGKPEHSIQLDKHISLDF